MLCAAGSIVAARMRTTIARLSRRRLLAASAMSIAAVALFRSVQRGRRRRRRLRLPPPSAPPPPEPIAVMSFNIRYGTANDGENHWTNRRDMLFALLRTENPDLIGLQEALRFQIDEILAAVPGYAVVGVGRDDGKAAGEMSAILFRTARFHVAASGTFWFSDTPEIPGSKSWGNRITRIASWARFVDRDGSAFIHYNLHLDHESQPSREKSTTLLLQRITARPVASEPVIVTGDFNAGESNPALHVLVGPAGPAAVQAPGRDAAAVHRHLPRGASRREGSRHVHQLRLRADVGREDRLRAGAAGHRPSSTRPSCAPAMDRRYPSDHFPVTARIRLPASTGGR